MLPEIDHDQSDSKTYLKISAKVAIQWVARHHKTQTQFILVTNEKGTDRVTHSPSANNEARRRLAFSINDSLQGIRSKIKRFLSSHLKRHKLRVSASITKATKLYPRHWFQFKILGREPKHRIRSKKRIILGLEAMSTTVIWGWTQIREGTDNGFTFQ